MRIQTPTEVKIITEGGDEMPHWCETPEDLEATLSIAQSCGWRVKYKNRFIQGE